MTEEEYYGCVRGLSLKPTNVKTVFTSPDGSWHHVDDPANYSPDQRKNIIKRLKARLEV